MRVTKLLYGVISYFSTFITILLSLILNRPKGLLLTGIASCFFLNLLIKRFHLFWDWHKT